MTKLMIDDDVQKGKTHRIGTFHGCKLSTFAATTGEITNAENTMLFD